MTMNAIETVRDGRITKDTVITVPVHPNLEARINADDLNDLVRLGVPVDRWTFRNHSVLVSGRHRPGSTHKHLSIARLLMDAQAGWIVRFKNHNPLDLRRENLKLARSAKGKHRDRDYIPTKTQKQAQLVEALGLLT